jgi:hypothetical protein
MDWDIQPGMADNRWADILESTQAKAKGESVKKSPEHRKYQQYSW